MIAFIKGTILSVTENSLIIDQSFIGLECIVPNISLYSQGSHIELYTYLHWHQENGPSFYGFSTNLEKQIFLQLIGCSGIGPKMAVSILEQMSPATLLETIIQEDVKGLSSLHGIGAKKAEQLRLLFVGITRAKHSLFLSYSNSQNNKPLELTEYLASVAERSDILETKNHELKQDDLSFEIVKSLRKSAINYTESFKDELKARISNFTFSPSTLNSYSNCPRSFLYSYLLQIPVKDRGSEAAYYGSAIHKTLETATTQAVKTGIYPDEEELIEMFIKKLSAQKFETLAQRKVYEVRGEKILR